MLGSRFRRSWLVATLGFVLASCSSDLGIGNAAERATSLPSSSAATSSSLDAGVGSPTTSAFPATTGSATATTTGTNGLAGHIPRGTLPDGTDYHVRAEPELREAIAATDELTNRVRYESFVVTEGCSTVAVACSGTNAVQVVPLPSWQHGGTVWIESDAPRPARDANWLDPGPLQPRGGHDVHWTGSEVLVWGGADGDRQPNLVDGARFDPVGSTWSIMATAPFDAGTPTRSVWADERLIVASARETFGYLPDSDSWTRLGDGVQPSRWPGFMVWSGGEAVTWNATGVHRFDSTAGRWQSLGAPPFGSDLSPWDGALRVDGGSVYAVGLAGTCANRRVARHDGDEWVDLAPVSLATPTYADCSFPNQTAIAAGRLLVWDNESHPTKTFVDGEWRETASVPLPGTEGAQGPVALDERFMVPQWGSATILDPATETWTEILDLPGSGSATDMVWTGSEVVVWGATCCYGAGARPFVIDAWRWTPPASSPSGQRSRPASTSSIDAW